MASGNQSEWYWKDNYQKPFLKGRVSKVCSWSTILVVTRWPWEMTSRSFNNYGWYAILAGQRSHAFPSKSHQHIYHQMCKQDWDYVENGFAVLHHMFYFVCCTFVGQRIYLVPQLLVQYPIPQSMIINPCLGSSGRRHPPKRYPGSKHAEMQHVRFVSFSKNCTNLPILNEQQWRG